MTAGRKPCSRPPINDSLHAERVVSPGTRKKMRRGGKRSKGFFSAFSSVCLTLSSRQPTCPLLLPSEHSSLHLLAHLALVTLAVLLRPILGGATLMQKNDVHPFYA